jgi:hypothetical protein
LRRKQARREIALWNIWLSSGGRETGLKVQILFAPQRFNALLGQAKASLVKGDRSAAINSLIAAKTQLRTCPDLEERDSTASVAVALNSPRSADIE